MSYAEEQRIRIINSASAALKRAGINHVLYQDDLGYVLQITPYKGRKFSVRIDALINPENPDEFIIEAGGKVFVEKHLTNMVVMDSIEHFVDAMRYAVGYEIDRETGETVDRSSLMVADEMMTRFRKATQSLPGKNWSASVADLGPAVRARIFGSVLFAERTPQSASDFFEKAERWAREHGIVLGTNARGRDARGKAILGYKAERVFAALSRVAGGLMYQPGSEKPFAIGRDLKKMPKELRRATRERVGIDSRLIIKTDERGRLVSAIAKGPQTIQYGPIGPGHPLQIAFSGRRPLGAGLAAISPVFATYRGFTRPTIKKARLLGGEFTSKNVKFFTPEDPTKPQYYGTTSIPLAQFGDKRYSIPASGYAGAVVDKRYIFIGQGKNAISDVLEMFGETLTSELGNEITMALDDFSDQRPYLVSLRKKIKAEIEKLYPGLEVVFTKDRSVSIGARVRYKVTPDAIKDPALKLGLSYHKGIGRRLMQVGADIMMNPGDVKDPAAFKANMMIAIAYSLPQDNYGRPNPYHQLGKEIREEVEQILKDANPQPKLLSLYARHAGRIEGIKRSAGWLPYFLREGDALVPEYHGKPVITSPEITAIHNVSPQLAESITRQMALQNKDKYALLHALMNKPAKELPAPVKLEAGGLFNIIRAIEEYFSKNMPSIGLDNPIRIGSVTLPSVSAVVRLQDSRFINAFARAIASNDESVAKVAMQRLREILSPEELIRKMGKGSLIGFFDRYAAFAPTGVAEKEDVIRLGKHHMSILARQMGFRVRSEEDFNRFINVIERVPYAIVHRYPYHGGQPIILKIEYDPGLKGKPQVSLAFSVAMLGDLDMDPLQITLLAEPVTKDGQRLWVPMPGAEEAYKHRKNLTRIALERMIGIGGIDHFRKYKRAAEKIANRPLTEYELVFGFETTMEVDDPANPGKKKKERRYVQGYNPEIRGAGQNMAVEAMKDAETTIMQRLAKADSQVTEFSREELAKRIEKFRKSKQEMGIYNIVMPMEYMMRQRADMVREAFGQEFGDIDPVAVIAESYANIYQIPLDENELNDLMASAYSAYNALKKFDNVKNSKHEVIMRWFAGLAEEYARKRTDRKPSDVYLESAVIMPEAIAAHFGTTADEMRRIVDYLKKYKAGVESTPPDVFFIREMPDWEKSDAARIFTASVAINAGKQDIDMTDPANVIVAAHRRRSADFYTAARAFHALPIGKAFTPGEVDPQHGWPEEPKQTGAPILKSADYTGLIMKARKQGLASRMIVHASQISPLATSTYFERAAASLVGSMAARAGGIDIRSLYEEVDSEYIVAGRLFEEAASELSEIVSAKDGRELIEGIRLAAGGLPHGMDEEEFARKVISRVRSNFSRMPRVDLGIHIDKLLRLRGTRRSFIARLGNVELRLTPDFLRMDGDYVVVTDTKFAASKENFSKKVNEYVSVGPLLHDADKMPYSVYTVSRERDGMPEVKPYMAQMMAYQVGLQLAFSDPETAILNEQLMMQILGTSDESRELAKRIITAIREGRIKTQIFSFMEKEGEYAFFHMPQFEEADLRKTLSIIYNRRKEIYTKGADYALKLIQALMSSEGEIVNIDGVDYRLSKDLLENVPKEQLAPMLEGVVGMLDAIRKIGEEMEESESFIGGLLGGKKDVIDPEAIQGAIRQLSQAIHSMLDAKGHVRGAFGYGPNMRPYSGTPGVPSGYWKNIADKAITEGLPADFFDERLGRYEVQSFSALAQAMAGMIPTSQADLRTMENRLSTGIVQTYMYLGSAESEKDKKAGEALREKFREARSRVIEKRAAKIRASLAKVAPTEATEEYITRMQGDPSVSTAAKLLESFKASSEALERWTMTVQDSSLTAEKFASVLNEAVAIRAKVRAAAHEAMFDEGFASSEEGKEIIRAANRRYKALGYALGPGSQIYESAVSVLGKDVVDQILAASGADSRGGFASTVAPYVEVQSATEKKADAGQVINIVQKSARRSGSGIPSSLPAYSGIPGAPSQAFIAAMSQAAAGGISPLFNMPGLGRQEIAAFRALGYFQAGIIPSQPAEIASMLNRLSVGEQMVHQYYGGFEDERLVQERESVLEQFRTARGDLVDRLKAKIRAREAKHSPTEGARKFIEAYPSHPAASTAKSVLDVLEESKAAIQKWSASIDQATGSADNFRSVIDEAVNVRAKMRAVSAFASLDEAFVSTDEGRAILQGLSKREKAIGALFAPGSIFYRMASARIGEEQVKDVLRATGPSSRAGFASLLDKAERAAAGGEGVDRRRSLMEDDARAINRITSGYFAWQFLRTLRYTFSPVMQAARQDEEQRAQEILAGASAGIPMQLTSLPVYRGQLSISNLMSGYRASAANVAGGFMELLAASGLGGRGLLGLVGPTALPAIGAGTITTIGLSQLAGMGGLAGMLAKFAGPIGIGVGSIVGAGALLSGYYGAIRNEADLARGVLRGWAAKDRPMVDLSDFGDIWASVSAEMNRRSVYLQDYLARNPAARLLTPGPAHEPSPAQRKMIEEESRLRQMAVANPFMASEPYEYLTMLESPAVPGTMLHAVAQKYGISEDQARSLYAALMGATYGSPVARYTAPTAMENLARIAGMGLSPEEHIKTAAEYMAYARGDLRPVAGMEYFAGQSEPLYGVALSQATQAAKAINLASTANKLVRAGAFATFDEAVSYLDSYARNALVTPGMGEAVMRSADAAEAYRAAFGRKMSPKAFSALVSYERLYGITPDRFFQMAETKAALEGIDSPTVIGQLFDRYLEEPKTPESLFSEMMSMRLLGAMGGRAGSKRVYEALGAASYLEAINRFNRGEPYAAKALSELAQLGGAERAILAGLPDSAKSILLSTDRVGDIASTLATPYGATMMAMAGHTGPGAAMMMDITSGGIYQIGQRSLAGIVPAGMTPMQFFMQGAQLRRGITGAAPAFANVGLPFQQRIVGAAQYGMMGLQMLANQVSYEGAMASAGISAASAREQWRYQTQYVFPSERAKMEMAYAQDFGGFVQTDWMKKHGIPGVDFGRGEFARRWAAFQMQIEDAGMNLDAQRTRLQWQLDDIARERYRFGIQTGWQRMDFDVAEYRRNIERQFRNYQLGIQGYNLARSRQYLEEDYLTGRMISEREFGWAMEDYERAIRRSSGEQRRQLIRQRERDIERFNTQQQLADRDYERAKERLAIEEELYEKQIRHIKMLDELEDEEFERAKERFETQVRWREEDFAIREERVRQEIAWLEEQSGRFMMNLELQKERLLVEEQRERAMHELNKVMQDAQEEHARKMHELALASAGLAAAQAEKQKAIAEAIEDIQRKQEEVFAQYELFMRRSATSFVDALIEHLSSKGISMNRPQLSQGANTVYPNQPIPRETGGVIFPNRPYLVGERGPEVIVPSHGGLILSNDKMRAPDPLRESRPESLVAVINIGGERLGEFIVPIIVSTMRDSVRRSRL